MEIKTQRDVNECGLVIIQAIHQELYDRWIDLNELKHKAKINSKGMTISNLKSLGKTYGINLEAYKGNFESYINSGNKGYVITMLESRGENHFVFFKLNRKSVTIVDPIKGQYRKSIKEFQKQFTGVVITFEKAEYIKEKVQKNFTLNVLFKTPVLFAWILITITLSLVLTFASTVFMKIIFDTIIPGRLKDTLLVLAVGFGWMAVLRVMNNYFKKYLLKKFQLNVETTITLEYFARLRNAEYLELTKVSQSDHLRRISLIEAVSSFLAHTIFISFSEVIDFIVAISFLIWINPAMFGMAVAAGGVVALSALLIQYRSRSTYDSLLEKQLKYLNTSMDHTFSVDALKEPVVNLQMKRAHESRYRTYKKTEWKLWNFNTFNGVISELVSMCFPILLTYIGVTKVFTHELSIGSMMMFLSLFHWFLSPIESVASLLVNLKKNMNNYKLIEFILNIKLIPQNKDGMKLGKIERLTINDYAFGYDKELFKIIWYEIKESLHIKGKNGSGKSTLLKILANRMKGTGDYSINGTELDFYNLDSVNEKIFYLSSNPYVFEGSVFQYITLNNQEAISRFNQNVSNYNLSKLFSNLGVSLDTVIENNGQNLSSGQKQMISVMRLFAFDYDLVVLDEALENIDVKNVSWLSKALPQVQDAIFIEVSHSKRYVTKAKEVDIEEVT